MGYLAIVGNRKRSKLTMGLLVASLLLGGCTNTPKPNNSPALVENPQEQPVKRLKTIPDRRFSADSLYALLVAELAFSRKRYDIALSNYVQQATTTQDIEVVSRATQIARGLNARRSALEMSQLWLDLDPSNPDARLIAAVELIEANHLIEAFELSRIMLDRGETTTFESIARRATKGDIKVVNELIERFGELLQNSTKGKSEAGLWLGQSILLQQAGKLDEALAAVKQAQAINSEDISSAFQETRVLHKMGKTELASARLAKLVEDHPSNIELRARYARLVWSRSPEEARDQFEILHNQAPGNAEILYSLALVEKDLGRHDVASERFKLLLSRNQYASAAHYHLGDILLNQNRPDTALEHLKLVNPGQNYAAAMVKATGILVGQNRRDEAVALLKQRQKTNEGSALESLYMLEADVFSQAGQMNAAEKALNEGVGVFPNSTRLLYARAMLYAQINYVTAAEKDLKRVLELVPENAAALNALGYTLADRTNRYQEAYEYIKQAYALTPDDPAVIDSMGWVAYSLGNYEQALTKLRRAMEIMPDHEIAAHYGEVLWVTGNHQEALAVWRKGLELKPESEIIHKTMHRLEAKLD